MDLVDPNAAINYVRQQRGLAPLPNPHVIEGFGGPTDAPTPSVLPSTLPAFNAADPFGLDMADEEPPRIAPVSPLIPAKPPEPELPRLVVQNDQALFDGKAVHLEARDVNAITKIILLAVERSVRQQLREIRSLIPKREKPAVVPKKRRKRGEAP